MRTLAFPLALLLVIATAVAAVGLLAGAEAWGRWLVRTGGALGVLGLVVTAGAVVNLAIPRTCATDAQGDEVNRPVASIALGDGTCFESGVTQLQVAVLVGVATSAVVSLRRSGRGADGAAPDVRSR